MRRRAKEPASTTSWATFCSRRSSNRPRASASPSRAGCSSRCAGSISAGSVPASRRAPLGQHFLRSPSILDRIARVAAAAGSSDLIIEIGAGPGTLTQRLLQLGRPVLAIEIDPRLAEGLRGRPNLEVLEADVLQVDLRELIASRAAGRALIAGNLPYYITSPILRMIFDAADRVSAAILLVQREVAARIAARPGTRDYGYLSVLCQAHSRPEIEIG